MDEQRTAEKVLTAVGGRKNVLDNMICMTRLRVTVNDPALVDRKALNSINSVLGIAQRGSNSIEVVFGPNVIDRIFKSFTDLTHLSQDMQVERSQHQSKKRSETPENKRSYDIQVKANTERAAQSPDSASMDTDDIELLEHMFPNAQAKSQTETNKQGTVAHIHASKLVNAPAVAAAKSVKSTSEGERLLIINGPNINMLGIREPDTYGTDTFADLLELCQQSAKEAGFKDCLCFQSNHEGDIVDQIQDAYYVFDGLIINPAAYTHTSIAILDAVKAIKIPTIEVHISDVPERESFRQVSYIREAAFETIMGQGIQGYRKAIFDMWNHLKAL